MRSPLRIARQTLGLTLSDVATHRTVATDITNLSRVERGLQKSVALAERLVRYFAERKVTLTEEQILYPERFPEKPSPARRGAASHARSAA